MRYKVIKLFFLIYLTLNCNVFSQGNHVNAERSAITQYNSWLKLTHLNKLLQASAFSSNTKGLSGNSTQKIAAIWTLVLTPTKDLAEPEKFASAWNKVRGKLQKNGINIYELLFNKLADYSFLPACYISLKIKTRDTDVFALSVYYDKKIEHKENIILGKGNKNVIDVNPAIDFMKDVCFETQKPQSVAGIFHTLHAIFKNYKAGNGGLIVDSMINDHQSRLSYRVANIDGVVTKTHLHEVVILNIMPDATGICYNVDVQYAGGLMAPDPDYHAQYYHEAQLKFSTECEIYKRKLDKTLRLVFNAASK